MHQDTELNELMQLIAKKSLYLLTNTSQSEQISKINKYIQELLNNIQHIHNTLFKNPDALFELQSSYWQRSVDLLHTQLEQWLKGESIPIEDKRFKGDEWVNNPFFNLISHHYLLTKTLLNSLAEQLDPRDESANKRFKFLMHQFLDALSPENFLNTNPGLIAETIQTQGKNLLNGLLNLLDDIDPFTFSLTIKMTDKSSFGVGKNLAITPGKVIFKNDMMELIQYLPQTPFVKSVPLLMIPPWINKYYILDLRPENSFVNWLVAQGITVFMISWANPDETFATKTLYDYLHQGPAAAINIIQQQLNIRQVNALGFCLGGTLLSMLLAFNKVHNNDAVRSATFLATMIDFSEVGDLSVFLDEEGVTHLEERMQSKGYLEGHVMANTFNSLRAPDLIWSFFINNYLKGKAPVPYDLLYWNTDVTNMPAKMHSEYLRWLYLDNKLIKPNNLVLNGTPLDVRNITIPSFFVATIKDHIAPWQTVYKGFKALGGKKQFLLGGSGHIAGIIIPPKGDKYGYYYNPKVGKTAEHWLEHAVHDNGSWWPKWFDWLQTKSGQKICALVFNDLPFKAIDDAPGSYVHVGAQRL